MNAVNTVNSVNTQQKSLLFTAFTAKAVLFTLRKRSKDALKVARDFANVEKLFDY